MALVIVENVRALVGMTVGLLGGNSSNVTAADLIEFEYVIFNGGSSLTIELASGKATSFCNAREIKACRRV